MSSFNQSVIKHKTNLLAYLSKDGKIVLDRNDPIVASSLTTINKEIVHAGAKEAGL